MASLLERASLSFEQLTSLASVLEDNGSRCGTGGSVGIGMGHLPSMSLRLESSLGARAVSIGSLMPEGTRAASRGSLLPEGEFRAVSRGSLAPDGLRAVSRGSLAPEGVRAVSRGSPIGAEGLAESPMGRSLGRSGTALSLNLEEDSENNPPTPSKPPSRLSSSGMRKVLFRRGTFKTYERRPLHEQLAEVGSYSGHFLDFLVRRQCEHGTRRDEHTVQKILDLLVKCAAENVGIAAFGVALVAREQLQHELMQGIIEESKERGIFPKVGFEAVTKWVRYVLDYKKQIMCLKVEVRFALLQWKLMHRVEAKLNEGVWDKKDRVESFYASFHSRSRILENGDQQSQAAAALHNSTRKRPERRKSSYGLRWDHPQGTAWKTFLNPTNTERRSILLKGLPPSAQNFTHPGEREQKAGQGGTILVGSRCASKQSDRAGSSGNNNGMGRLFDASGSFGALPTHLSAMRPVSPVSTMGAMTTTMTRQSLSLPELRDPKGHLLQRPNSNVGLDIDQQGGSRLHLPPLNGTAGKQKYLKECDSQHRTPMALAFTTGHSSQLLLQGKDLVDSELIAIAASLPEMEFVEEANIFGNALLTDRGIVHLLRQLSKPDIRYRLTSLNLGHCSKAGCYSLDVLVSSLRGGGALRYLNLSQVPVASSFQIPLCDAIGRHPCLAEVDLTETGLNHHEVTKTCLELILKSRSLTTLDLSWNNFNGAVFLALGEAVVSSHALKELRVANCAATTTAEYGSEDKFVPPLSLFLEKLAHDKTLSKLDISLNHCDFRTALILEDSLEKHIRLRELVLCNNPLGSSGIRSMLRLLCREQSGLERYDTEGCYVGTSNESGQTFSYTNPGGKYVLDLWRPYHRALLRMLYKITERSGCTAEEAFDKVQFRCKKPKAKKVTSAAWKHCERDSHGIWEVPTDGELSFVFNVEKAIFKRFGSEIAASDCSLFLSSFYEEMRFTPGFRKVVPLLSRWHQLNNNQLAQDAYILALSKDFNLTLPQVHFMCEASRSMVKELLWQLSPCIQGGTPAMYLSGQIFYTIPDYIWVYVKMENLLNFNADNPTGHYALDLANCSDYAVAERLLLLDRWEAAMDHKHERKDTSHRGNGSHIRNEIYQGRPLSSLCNSVAEWQLPEHGSFIFDFISNHRHPRTSEVLSDETWESILVHVHNSQCSPDQRILVLRAISHNFLLRSMHMRALIGYFKTEEQRSEVFIIFFLRIVDMHNAKMFRVRFENEAEVRRLQERLGYATFFPFFQPENARFELDLSIFDQRLCASMFVLLATKEKYPHNIHDYGYRRVDGKEDPMPLGVPRSWGDINSIPKDGVFRGKYMCAPEYKNLAFRKELAKIYGYLDVEGLQDGDISWWTGLTEPPEDVLNLLEFFISRFDDIEEPFKQIDGAEGNGEITLRELMEGLDAMKCKKFDPPKGKGQKPGPTKEQRVDAIFRYLDPGGEGSVSREEWAILGQLWNEFEMSIREFVHFLVLTFGDDLNEAWEALDDDGSQELSEQEFHDAIEMIGYFGPAKVVYALLDSSDDGNISVDEFAVLEKYKPKDRPVSSKSVRRH